MINGQTIAIFFGVPISIALLGYLAVRLHEARVLSADDGCCHHTGIRGVLCPDGRVCPYDAEDPLGLTALKSEVDALHARVEAMRDRVVGCTRPPDDAPTPCPTKHALQDCLAAVEMCECGAMTAVNCGELPSLRHCGKWDV